MIYQGEESSEELQTEVGNEEKVGKTRCLGVKMENCLNKERGDRAKKER